MIYTIIDIETTGFNSYKDNILEVGYININDKKAIVGSGSFYFYKPEWLIETQAQSVHHIERRFLEEYEKEFQVNLSKLYTLMYNRAIIGKNSNQFDIPFIQRFINKYASTLSTPLPILSIDLQDIYTEPFREWYKTKYGAVTKKKGKLEELIEMLGHSEDEIQRAYTKLFPDCKRVGKHSALYDVYMTYLLLLDAIESKKIVLREF